MWLNKPYPYIEDTIVKLALSFGIGLICFLTIVIFRPFGLEQVKDVSFLFGFGVNALIVMLLHFFILPLMLKRFFDPSKWNIKKQFLLFGSILLSISIINYFYNSIIGKEISPQYGFITLCLMTTAVGFLPIMLMTYVTEKVENKRNQNLASEIQATEKLPFIDYKIEINSNNSLDGVITLSSSTFIYALSSGNYCTIYYITNNNIEKKLIRLSLKALQEQMNNDKQFLRCHKSYVINKAHINTIEGNARSLFVTLKDIEKDIPVSRSFNKALLK